MDPTNKTKKLYVLKNKVLKVTKVIDQIHLMYKEEQCPLHTDINLH